MNIKIRRETTTGSGGILGGTGGEGRVIEDAEDVVEG